MRGAEERYMTAGFLARKYISGYNLQLIASTSLARMNRTHSAIVLGYNHTWSVVISKTPGHSVSEEILCDLKEPYQEPYQNYFQIY